MVLSCEAKSTNSETDENNHLFRNCSCSESMLHNLHLRFCEFPSDILCICIYPTVNLLTVLMNLQSAVYWCWNHGLSNCFCTEMPVLPDEWDAPASSQRCHTGFGDISDMANCTLPSGSCTFCPGDGEWSSRCTKRRFFSGSEKEVMLVENVIQPKKTKFWGNHLMFRPNYLFSLQKVMITTINSFCHSSPRYQNFRKHLSCPSMLYQRVYIGSDQNSRTNKSSVGKKL